MSTTPRIVPHLIVAGAPRAIDFYVANLGAVERSRFVDERLAKVVHAELALGDTSFTVAEESLEWHNPAPTSLGGSPVVLTLHVADADTLWARLLAAGATVIFPLADQFYGERQGRLRDPFGHIWLLSQQLEDLSNEEIQRRVDAYKP